MKGFRFPHAFQVLLADRLGWGGAGRKDSPWQGTGREGLHRREAGRLGLLPVHRAGRPLEQGPAWRP